MRSFLALSIFAASATTQTINPTTVPLSTRQSWCINQKAACPLLCEDQTGSGTPKSNTCDAATLDYACICKNGAVPNSTQYSETIPYYECTEYNNQCVTACGSNATCAAACRTDNPCGASDPSRVAVTSTASKTSTATGSAATTTGFTSFGGADSDSSTSSAGFRRTVIDLGSTFGLGAVVGSLLAGFGVLL